MTPRQKAYAAFLKSEGAFAEPDDIQQRRNVRARAVQPAPPPSGPRPNSPNRQQLAKRREIGGRVDQRFASETSAAGLKFGSSFEERAAEQHIRSAMTETALIDAIADLEDLVADLTARIVKLEEQAR